MPYTLMSGKISEALKLPTCTFVSFQQPSGMVSCHTYPEDARGDDYTQLSLVLRAPQKWECSIGGVAITHVFETGITTCLNIGFAFTLDQYQVQSSRPEPLTSFFEQVQDAQSHWTHPLMLPCLFLITHVQRVRAYLFDQIGRDIVHIERSVSVTTAGRSQLHLYDSEGPNPNTTYKQLFVNGQMQRACAKELIAKINDISTWIIYAKRSPQWDIDCIDFVLDLLNNNSKLQLHRGSSERVFLETLMYVRNYSEACKEFTLSSEARMLLQLNILYTSIAQDDGQTSARLAAAAGRDSTSMKIIALIAAAYLPGTFVATLFIMGMFSWQSSSNGRAVERSSVSPDFWVYWAITVPLTILTLMGWAVWWKVEKYCFDRDVPRVAQQQTGQRSFGEQTLPWKSGHA